MIRNQTPAEILRHGLDQCACYGAPGDMMATLRGALAFVEVAEDAAAENAIAPKRTSLLVPSTPLLDAEQEG